MTMEALDPSRECRPLFPALCAHPDFIFADSAGGSAILGSCITNIQDYYTDSNVQIGGSYPASALCISRIHEAAETTAKLLNASSGDEICFVSSTTQGMENLARAMEPILRKDDEIIVTNTDHEANIGPWMRLAERAKVALKVWELDTESFMLPIEKLKGYLSEKTRLVAVTHCSNITGTFNPIKEIAELVHAANPRAEIVVDGVAYTAHRIPDVKDLDVDYYAFSYYKVYGPHISVLYTRKSAQDKLSSLAHYFLNSTSPGPLKLVPGGPNFELSYATTAVFPYLKSLSGLKGAQLEDIQVVKRTTNQRIAAHEARLMAPLLEFLRSRKSKGVKIMGLEDADSARRAPTVSLVVNGKSCKDIAESFDEQQIGVRWGMFYANRLCEGTLGLGEEGVVRISFVHYNTLDEVDRIIEHLKTVI